MTYYFLYINKENCPAIFVTSIYIHIYIYIHTTFIMFCRQAIFLIYLHTIFNNSIDKIIKIY